MGGGLGGWGRGPLCHCHGRRVGCRACANREVPERTHRLLLPTRRCGACEVQEQHRHLQDRGHVLPPALELWQKGPQALAAHRDPLPASRQATNAHELRGLGREKGLQPPEPPWGSSRAALVEGPQAKAMVGSPGSPSPAETQVPAQPPATASPGLGHHCPGVWGGRGCRHSLGSRRPKRTPSRCPGLQVKAVAPDPHGFSHLPWGQANCPLSEQVPQARPSCLKVGCTHKSDLLYHPLPPHSFRNRSTHRPTGAHLRSLSLSTFRGRQEAGPSATAGVLTGAEPPARSWQWNWAPVRDELLLRRVNGTRLREPPEPPEPRCGQGYLRRAAGDRCRAGPGWPRNTVWVGLSSLLCPSRLSHPVWGHGGAPPR